VPTVAGNIAGGVLFVALLTMDRSQRIARPWTGTRETAIGNGVVAAKLASRDREHRERFHKCRSY
jgi:hypothetical protein